MDLLIFCRSFEGLNLTSFLLILQILLAYKPDVDLASDEGMTPLIRDRIFIQKSLLGPNLCTGTSFSSDVSLDKRRRHLLKHVLWPT